LLCDCSAARLLGAGRKVRESIQLLRAAHELAACAEQVCDRRVVILAARRSADLAAERQRMLRATRLPVAATPRRVALAGVLVAPEGAAVSPRTRLRR